MRFGTMSAAAAAAAARWVLAAGVCAGGAGAARAATVSNPFAETFATGAQNWRQDDGVSDAVWNAGGQYVSAAAAISGNQQVLFRARNSYNSSNGSLSGNWLAAGITTLTFSVRHDGAQALQFGARIATAGNFPGVAATASTLVQPNTWTDVSIAISPAMLTEEMAGTYASTLSNVGAIQIFVPSGFAATGSPVNFSLDNVAVTPEPGVIGVAGVGAAGLLMRRRRQR